ncbi:MULTISPECIES: efflux RND transporter periplasmic adaptor subunit [Chryseobacterium]|jgi:membrane fusion protein (multidrug efflux system)|uniref:Efflux RND transporter periplasmic adaptor subunit n=1 Tax=Chryseobacterium indoltheticum TaxID=254 RepID=A0A381FFP5_9FLAO|nr:MULTISPECIES: efflux RND transporter periplasmic adaptor subunit [Chryseobacterium]AZA59912.1 efflux RND transporter periplasmic adaptor subunit [Chryseobacterium indoltheticum]AZA74419.1 efflux RND transporter periplasmic adaptor subunit [Chryseobacterium indoltheticum]MDF2832216.1 efflux transporter periplasmic adaptor subunit [Chryseobacterium indoltheticum]MDQ8140679.1 efflux RND transporter periplasmic adaptor subunit [Chryseobacterium sp. CFS15]QQQ28782.1 efflux RND transporter peripl
MTNKLILFSVAAFSLTACKKEAPKQDGPKPFPVVSVENKNVVGYDTFPASIEGRVNNDVRAKIQGYITQVLVDEGQYVTKGQPLFRLETNILTENAAASKAGIGAAESNIAAAQAQVNAANVEVNKLKPLVQKNIISNVQLQTAQANLAQAQAGLQQAIAAKRQAVANYKGVEANIDYSVIRAPISGVIGKLPLKVGSLVGPTDQVALTTISDTSEIFAYFSMNEKSYFDFLENSVGANVPEKIKNLPMVELELANGSIYPEKGRIEAITGSLDPTTGTIQFRVSFKNAQKLLSNGNSGTIRFPKRYDNVLVVPESATYEQQGIVYVYKVEKDTARNTVVEVIERIDNLALIKSGVKKGEVIIAAGTGNIKPGTAVKPKKVSMDSLVQSVKPKF